MNKLITGVVAGVIVFVWGMLSWMALPFHKESFKEYKAHALTTKAILASAPTSGMYMHPKWETPPEEAAKEPHILTVVRHEEKSFPLCMLKGLLIQIFAGLAITCMISCAKLESYKDKVLMALKAAVFAGAVGVLPNWLWWGFTGHYTILAFADLLIGWSIAGLWIAKRI